MVRRLKIYFIHSAKMDYQNLLYRYVLSSSVCLNHELMLPLTKNYQDRYVKDLMASADLIIAEVSDYNLGLKLELKWAAQIDKPIKYISLTNIIPKKIKKYVPELEQITAERSMVKIIEDFVTYYASMSKAQQEDPTVVLGDL